MRWPPVVLAVATVGLQIAYPLVHGVARDRLTVAIVLAAALTSLTHAALSRGPLVALALLLVGAVPSFAAEVLGVHIGVPFGSYVYGTGLGVRLFGVPGVVAAAWTMLAWPAALVAARLVRSFVARVLIGAWALAVADLYLDPQLVAAGQWRWRFPSPHLPGVPGVPLTNYAGWLLVALVLSAGLQLVLRHSRTVPFGDDGVVLAFYVWLWVGWAVALVAFLGLGAAGVWGAVGMGTVAVPLLVRPARRA